MHESHHQQGIKDEILHPAVANRHGIHGDDGESGQSRDGLMVHCRLKVDMQCACMPSQTKFTFVLSQKVFLFRTQFLGAV